MDWIVTVSFFIHRLLYYGQRRKEVKNFIFWKYFKNILRDASAKRAAHSPPFGSQGRKTSDNTEPGVADPEPRAAVAPIR
jgi:hypothetical protein